MVSSLDTIANADYTLARPRPQKGHKICLDMSLADAPEIPICEAKAENIFDLELLEDQIVQFGLEAGKFGAICLDLSRFRDNSAPQLSLLLVWFCRPLVQTLCSLALWRLSINE